MNFLYKSTSSWTFNLEKEEPWILGKAELFLLKWWSHVVRKPFWCCHLALVIGSSRRDDLVRKPFWQVQKGFLITSLCVVTDLKRPLFTLLDGYIFVFTCVSACYEKLLKIRVFWRKIELASKDRLENGGKMSVFTTLSCCLYDPYSFDAFLGFMQPIHCNFSVNYVVYRRHNLPVTLI